jgi:predicted Ser/Thr protein kinase
MGPLVDANRGVLEFSDFLKRPVEAFKYLLSTVETTTVTMDSFVLHLDMLYLASTNEKYLDAFKEHHDFPSFKGRIELVKVPYLRRYSEECEIYRPLINERTVGRHVAPHSIEVASMWAVLTRMRRNDPKRYSKELGEVVEGLTPMDKIKLYDTGEAPLHLSARLAKELKQSIPELYNESIGYPNYEGRFGASAREIRTAMLNAAHSDAQSCLSPFGIFEELNALLESKSVYDFLKQDVVGKYHDHRGFLEATRNLFMGWVDDEIRDSMGLAPEDSYGELFARYIHHVSHWVKQEKLLDPASGDFVHADERFMREVEKTLMGATEKEEDFRKSVIGTIGARALDLGDTPDYGDIFKGYILRLKEAFYSSRMDEVKGNINNFLKYMAEERTQLDPKELKRSEEMLTCLTERYGYCEHCSQDAANFLLRERYGE